MNRGWSARIVRLTLAALGLAALGAAAIAGRSAQREVASLESTHYAVPRPAGEPWLAAASDVSLPTPRGAVLRGWRLPSRNGAAILFVTGSGADRTQRLTEARIVTSAGYGALVFDLPGNGESTGRKRRGDEQDFLRVALDALASAPDVNPDRIGAFGFSTGAAVLSEVAAGDKRVRAVVLAGCYTDTEEHVRQDFRRWGSFSGVPALWAARWAGLVALHPLRNVPAIAPRGLFLITGDADPVVSFDSAERLYAAASEPKELWIVHGAPHGHYEDFAGDLYARRLLSFFDRFLLPRPPPAPVP